MVDRSIEIIMKQFRRLGILIKNKISIKIKNLINRMFDLTGSCNEFQFMRDIRK